MDAVAAGEKDNIVDPCASFPAGLRRAGISLETRQALKHVYRQLFRSGQPLKKALASVRAEFAAKNAPPEVAELIEFCSGPTKRGICRGPRSNRPSQADDGHDDGE